jgi:putative ABC transport system permease protein
MRDWAHVVRERVDALGHGAADQVLVEELAAHLAQIYEEARDDGNSDAAAVAAAMRVLDASELLRQTVAARRPTVTRQVREWSRQEPAPIEKGSWMTALDVSRDLRHAARMILRAPGFSVIAILTFAVGIGVNTAVFNVVNGVLLRPLPYPDADRITMLWMDNRRQNIREDITSYPGYIDWKTQSTSYEHVAAFTPSAFSLTGSGEPERLQGAAVTANFFDVMGITPAIGRVFTLDHETPGKDSVVVLSHGLWQRRFGGAADVIGRTITLNGRPREIIGVMPPALRWPDRAELWAPLAPAQQLRDARNSFWLPVIGRLKPNTPIAQAQAEMTGIGDRLEQAYPATKGYGIYVVGLQQQLVGNIERPLLVLLGAVGFVLLIACANLANLMLGRTAARRKELAIRTALGAGRGVLIRQIVSEAFVLAAAGGVVGVILAYWATSFFVALGGDSIPRHDAIAMDARVLLFALALAALAALLSGLVPALHGSRKKIVDHLREGSRQGSGGASRRTRNVLVAAEVALSLILLTGAGLLIRTLWTMQQAPRGFSADRVAMMTLSAPAAAYAKPPDVHSFYARVLARVRALPGVESAASGTAVLQPLITNSTGFTIEGIPLPPREERLEYPVEVVSPGYFDTLGMTITRGRGFTDGDDANAPLVVVVNETFADLAWPGADPIGRRIRPGDENSPPDTPWNTVVGVIRDAHRAEVTRAIRPEVYFSTLQNVLRTQTLFVRTAGNPDAIIPAVRREVQAIDPQLPLFRVTTLEREIGATLAQPRFQAVLLAVFATIALLLATIGIYGVTSHAVGQRTQEVGIRMAMGAARHDVLRLMLLQHLRPALIGLAIGLAGAVALSRFLQSLLFGVAATDPATFSLVALVLLVVAAGACLVPARRATRVDPVVALRMD